MKELAVSVVIPTKDRCELLRRTLDCLGRQEGYSEPFEVIVADDGSSDGTAGFLGAPSGFSSFTLRSVRLAGAGPATARNRAIALATAPRVLLLGDDTFPGPDALAQHGVAAAGGEVGVQGRIEWDPGEPVTPVMRFLAPEGPQFYFSGLERGRPIPYTALYASNLSAPTRWFRDDPFDESFSAAAFEDTELGYRWARKGRRVVYWDQAVCHHHHPYASLEPFLVRQRLAGRGARYAARLHPGMLGKTVLQPLAVGILFAARYGLRRLLGNAADAELWDLQVRKAFLQGFLGGIRQPALRR
ncbi:MAG: glycosyltransferase family 2 protein [Thermoanaerobaculia bacterium]